MKEEGRDIIDALVAGLGIKVKTARMLLRKYDITSVDQVLAMDEHEIFALDGDNYAYLGNYVDIMNGVKAKGLSIAAPKQDYSKEEIDKLDFVRVVCFNKSLAEHLKKIDVWTLEDLCARKASDLVRWCNASKPTIERLEERLAEKGLALKPEFENAEFLESLPVPHAMQLQLGRRGLITKEDFEAANTKMLASIRGINMRTVYELDKELQSRGVKISMDENYKAFKERVEAAQTHIDSISDENVKTTLSEALDGWMRTYKRD